MYYEESSEVESPAIRDSKFNFTHKCCDCEMELEYSYRDETAEIHCIVCDDYRIFVPITYSPIRRWCAVATYQARKWWRNVKHDARRS